MIGYRPGRSVSAPWRLDCPDFGCGPPLARTLNKGLEGKPEVKPFSVRQRGLP